MSILSFLLGPEEVRTDGAYVDCEGDGGYIRFRPDGRAYSGFGDTDTLLLGEYEVQGCVVAIRGEDGITWAGQVGRGIFILPGNSLINELSSAKTYTFFETKALARWYSRNIFKLTHRLMTQGPGSD